MEMQVTMEPLVLSIHDPLLLHTFESWKRLLALLYCGNPAFGEEFMEIGNTKVGRSPNLDIEVLLRPGTLTRATIPFPVIHQQPILIGDLLEHPPIRNARSRLHIATLYNGLGTHLYASLCNSCPSQLRLLHR